MIPSSCAEYVAPIWLAMSHAVVYGKVGSAPANPVDDCAFFAM
jgi:hypothetical protein